MSESEIGSGGIDPEMPPGASKQRSNNTWMLRWGGRLIGVLAGGFFAMFAVAHIIEGFQTGEFNPQGIAPISLILIAALGVLMSFYWERAGGLLTLVGGLGMGLLVIMLGGIDDLGVALLFAMPLGVAGWLSLICGNRERRYAH